MSVNLIYLRAAQADIFICHDQYVRLHQDISYGGNLILIDWSSDFFSSCKIYLAPIIIRLCQFEAPLLVSLVYLVLNKKTQFVWHKLSG